MPAAMPNPTDPTTILSRLEATIAARRAGKVAEPLALHFPNATDGLLGLQFVDAVIRSNASNGAWTTV